MMYSKAAVPLSIVVVGGGVGGLAVSILLAQAGHQVTTIESKDGSFDSQNPGGLCLTWNSVRWLHEMGLEHELAHVAATSYDTFMMRYDTGETVKSFHRDLPFSMVHRADVLKILYPLAVKTGVKVHFGSRVLSVADTANQATIKLSDGAEQTCDLIVGADGIQSVVRHALFPNISPQLTSCVVMLVDVPESIMEQNPGTSEMYHRPPSMHQFMGAGRFIVAYRISQRHSYHLQMCDFEYGTGELYSLEDPPDGPYIAKVADNSGLIKRWSDHEPRIQHIVNSTSSFMKWKVAEVPPLASYSSASGRLILLGDAAHAVKPFAGQGANMAIEDAKTLSTLLSLISSKDEIPDVAHVYDALRTDRLAGIREIIETNMQMFGMKGNEEQKRRDEELVASSKQQHESDRAIVGESKWKGLGSVGWDKWIKEFDAESEAQKAWAQIRTGKT